MLRATLVASAILFFSQFASAQKSQTLVYDGFNVYVEVSLTNAFNGPSASVSDLQVNYLPSILGAVVLRKQEHVRTTNIKKVSTFIGVDQSYRRIEIDTDSPQFNKIIIYTFSDNRTEFYVYNNAESAFIGRRHLEIFPLRCGLAFTPQAAAM